MPAAYLSACRSCPSAGFSARSLLPPTLRASRSAEGAGDGRLREAKKPGNDVPGFFVTSDGANSGADNNRDRRSRRKAHSRNRPAGSNQVRSRNSHSAGGECAGGQTESQSGANAPRLSRRWRGHGGGADRGNRRQNC
jgi:hypothetical protein